MIVYLKLLEYHEKKEGGQEERKRTTRRGRPTNFNSNPHLATSQSSQK